MVACLVLFKIQAFEKLIIYLGPVFFTSPSEMGTSNGEGGGDLSPLLDYSYRCGLKEKGYDVQYRGYEDNKMDSR